MTNEKWWNVNWEYLSIKAHYFFFFGGMGGAVPFMSVLAKDLGINATAYGLIYTAVPFCVFLSKPLFGYITDFFRNIKAILMLLIIVTTMSFLLVLLIPPIQDNSRFTFNITALCLQQQKELILLPSSYSSLCLTNMVNKSMTCKLTSTCLPMKHLSGKLNVSENYHSIANYTFTFTFTATAGFPSAQNCDCMITNYSYVSCDLEECKFQEHEYLDIIYRNYNFWLFAFLAIISGTGMATIFCLSDAACCEVLGDNTELYGRQRVWATISWGITTFLAGFLNDIASDNSAHTDYSPGFYLMLACVVVDLVILSRMKLFKTNISTNICKDVGKIYQYHQTILFSFGVYVVGALTGLLWNYEFWYLRDLGASQTLLGVVVAVQCLLSEVPFFFSANWFITTFGHFYCLIGSLAVFALRTGLYSILKDPWLVLPIDLLHGLSYAIFYATMTSYASNYAPPGTEATMLGVLGGLFEGLGVATGSLLGGVGFDQISGKRTFFVASMISLCFIPFMTISYNTIKNRSSKLKSHTEINSITNYGTSNFSN